jgi:hypothetical protein
MLIGDDIARKKLERHKAPEPRVFSFVNHAHSAAPEFLDDSVMRDGLADHFARNYLPLASTTNRAIVQS